MLAFLAALIPISHRSDQIILHIGYRPLTLPNNIYLKLFEEFILYYLISFHT